MSKEDDKVQLLNAIKLVHQHVKLDNYLQDILIAAVKQLKKVTYPALLHIHWLID